MQPVWVPSLLVQQKTACAIRAGKVLLLAVIRDVIAKHYLTELEPIQSHTSSIANCARRRGEREGLWERSPSHISRTFCCCVVPFPSHRAMMKADSQQDPGEQHSAAQGFASSKALWGCRSSTQLCSAHSSISHLVSPRTYFQEVEMSQPSLPPQQ